MRSCIVLGCGRSGTSLAAGLLRDAGYSFGPARLPPTRANPRGYFESREVNELNEEILREVFPFARFIPSRIAKWLRWGPYYGGQLWLTALSEPVEWNISAATRTRIERLTNRTPFAYKDPRFCYTLNAWKPFLPADCRFVCVFRQPSVVADSILRNVATAPYLDNLSLTVDEAINVWTCMYRIVLKRHYEQPDRWLFVSYDDILAGEGARAIGRHLEAEVDTTFAKPSLNRSDAVDVALPEETRRIYSDLRERAGAAGRAGAADRRAPDG